MAERPQTTKIAMIVVLALVLAGVLLVRLGVFPTGSKKSGSPSTPAPAGQPKAAPASAPAAKAAPAKAATTWKRPDPVGPIARDPTRMDLPPEALRPKQAADVPPAAPPEP